MLFAHTKRILRLDRLRLREPNGARDASVPRTDTGERSRGLTERGSQGRQSVIRFPQIVRGVVRGHGGCGNLEQLRLRLSAAVADRERAGRCGAGGAYQPCPGPAGPLAPPTEISCASIVGRPTLYPSSPSIFLFSADAGKPGVLGPDRGDRRGSWNQAARIACEAIRYSENRGQGQWSGSR
jgi:hypothetical protein